MKNFNYKTLTSPFCFGSRRMMPKNQTDEARIDILTDMHIQIRKGVFDKTKKTRITIFSNHINPKIRDFCDDFINRYNKHYNSYI